MHRVNDATIHGGKLILSGLPFAEGQHVSVIVAAVAAVPDTATSIQEIRQRLRGGVERFDAPFEPVLPADDWEMLQ